MTHFPFPRLLLPLLFSALLLLLSSSTIAAGTDNAINAQHAFKRHDDAASANGPPIEFVTTPQQAAHEKPALIQPLYNQFSSPPSHHRHHRHQGGNEKGGLSKGKFRHWLQKLGLHASKKQVNELYAKVEADMHHSNRRPLKGHHDKKKDSHSHRKKGGDEGQGRGQAWKEIDKSGKEIQQPKPVSAGKLGVLPPGTPAKPRVWGDENPSSSSKSSSPVAAAVAPLPEPAINSIPSATPPSHHSSINPPIPAGSMAPKDSGSNVPLTTVPSSTTEPGPAVGAGGGTSGSINPSSTPPPPPVNAPGAGTGESGGNGKGAGQKTVAGIPVADDGDMKTPDLSIANSTAVDGKRTKSGATAQVEGASWSISGTIAAASSLGLILFFAI